MEASGSFWLDLDVGDDEKKYDTQADAIRALWAFCEELGLLKPIVVSSGYGVHCYWPMGEDVRPHAWKLTAELLKKATQKWGLKVGQTRTADSASVLRRVGTHNRKKPEEPKKVKIVARGDGDGGHPQFHMRLEAFVGEDVVLGSGPDIEGSVNPRLAGDNSDLSGPPPEYRPSDANKIADKCAIIGEMRDTGGNIPEPHWHDAIGVLARTVQGGGVCHEWSKGYAGYSHRETQGKIDRALGLSGPTTCQKLSDHRPDVCNACPYWQKITSPIALGEAPGAAGADKSRDDEETVEETVEEATDKRKYAYVDGWLLPSPISREPLPVPPWEPRFLPAVLADMVVDEADSVPMSREAVASNVTATAGALLSDKALVHLKRTDHWYEASNAWALNLAQTGERKTPTLGLCETALKRVEEDVYDQDYKAALATYQTQKIAYETAKKALAKGGAGLLPPEPEEPVRRRAALNDCTYEALSVAAKGGPVVVMNDEASGLFTQMADPKNGAARAFYLAAYNGTNSYKAERIGRGPTSISRLCVSLICNIQPEPLQRLVLGAAREGRQADGFMQRFGLMVMPEPLRNTKLVDGTTSLFKYTNGMNALMGLVTY